MKAVRLIVVVVVGLVLISGALVFLGAKRSDKITQFQKQAETELRYKKADVYYKGSESDKKYVDDLFEFGKETARQDLGGFFAGPPSEQKYFTTLYQAMIDQAKQQGKADLAKSLHKWIMGQNFLDVKF